MKKTTRRLMATCMVLGMAAMALGGCSSSKKKVIGVSLPTQDLARTQKDQEYLTKYLTEMGYEVNVQFGKGDANIQASSIENMITSGVAGLIISPFDSSSMTKVIELAHENNIPVISYDSLCLNTEYIDYYSADDLEGIGACQAQYIVDHLGVAEGKGPFNIEIVAGDPADNNATYFYKGAMDVLSPYLDDGSLVVPSGQIEFAVLTQNDGIALGAISSLKSVGYGSSDMPLPITTGQDCDIASIKSILAGEQTMTVFKDISVLAKNAADVIDSLVKGEEPKLENYTTFNNGVKDVKATLVIPKALDKDNCDELLFDSGYYSKDMLN